MAAYIQHTKTFYLFAVVIPNDYNFIYDQNIEDFFLFIEFWHQFKIFFLVNTSFKNQMSLSLNDDPIIYI